MRLGKCPFCGGEPRIVTTEQYFYEAKATGHECILIECGCGCQKWYHDASDMYYETALEVAADEWNRRTFYV